MCRAVAKKICGIDYRGEREDITQNLLTYLLEHGHVINHPEHKGAIYNFLLLTCARSDKLRERRAKDDRHTSTGRGEPGAHELPDGNETAWEILERIAYKELLGEILQQAKGDQFKEAIKLLSEGATQTEAAKSCGVSQSQISRWLATLRRRVKALFPVAGSPESGEKN